MRVRLKHFDTMSFSAIADSDQRVVMSGAPVVGGAVSGDAAGARPMEIVLMGLGGCSGIDVLLILKKSRQRVRTCEIDIQATRADSIPAVFTRIHVHYIFSGENLNLKKVARAVALSMEKYCSVTRMLVSTVAITHDFEIITPATEDAAEDTAKSASSDCRTSPNLL